MDRKKLWIGTQWEDRILFVIDEIKPFLSNKGDHLDIGVLTVDSNVPICLQKFKELGYNSTGADVSRENLEECKKLGFKTKYCNVNKEMDFKDNSFDVITLISVIEHVNNRKLFSDELLRVLKKNGKLVVQIPNPYFIVDLHFSLPFWGYLPKSMRNFYVKLAYKNKPPLNYDTYKITKRELLKLFNKFKLRFVESYIYPKEILPEKFRKFYKIFNLLKLNKIFPMGFIFVFEKAKD